jgi:SAM-dependent methyltransferase
MDGQASEGREAHWDTAYRDRGVSGVSWFQSEPTMSLELIERIDVATGAAVVDVGAGASSLVDHLLQRAFTDVSVLDVSEAALEVGRRRVGAAGEVKWLHEDLLSWRPARRYGLWHDRAVFHFLTEAADRDRYLSSLKAGIEPGGGLIMAAFAEDGPEYCSGSPGRSIRPNRAARTHWLGLSRDRDAPRVTRHSRWRDPALHLGGGESCWRLGKELGQDNQAPPRLAALP